MLPPANHPLWKTIQTFFAVIGVGILVWHLEHSGVGNPDLDAAVGTGGLAVGAKLLWQSVRS